MATEKNIRKLTWNSKVLNIKSKDRDGNIPGSVFRQQSLKDESLMLATICNDPWNVRNMQQITTNSKRRDFSDIPGGSHKN